VVATRRYLNQEEMEGLVRAWHYAVLRDEKVEPLQQYLGLTNSEFSRYMRFGQPYTPSQLNYARRIGAIA